MCPQTCRVVVLPYVAQTSFSQQRASLERPRPMFASFQGNTNLSSCFDVHWTARNQPKPQYCSLRSRLIEVLRKEKGFHMADSDSNGQQTSQNYSAASYVDLVRDSVFCLMPRGDTPSRYAVVVKGWAGGKLW